MSHADPKDLKEAKDWAYKRLYSDENFLILDTETTGLGDAEIVDICVMSRYGQELLSTLVKPTIPIPADSTRIHKITDAIVETAPTFPDIYPRLKALTEEKVVVIYNASFDFNVIQYCCKLHNLPEIKIYTECAMLWYAQYKGDWNSYYGNYCWQKLPGGGEHRALSDCRCVYRLLKKMAKVNYSQLQPEIPYRMFPPIQLWVDWEKFIRVEIIKTNVDEFGTTLSPIRFFIKIPRLRLLAVVNGSIKKEDFSFDKLLCLLFAEDEVIEKHFDDNSDIPF
jgi:DNA polymerase III epsilon subunit-like protein